MVIFVLAVIALLTIGTHLVRLLWLRFDPQHVSDTRPAELITAAALVGLGLLLAINWVLALTHRLTATALWICVGLLFCAALSIGLRSGRTLLKQQISWDAGRWLIFLIPLGLWIVFILWRGVVLPPASHDALAYHLPKAVLLERAAGYEFFQAPDPRIDKYPFNYELLLADTLMLGKTDEYTEWIGTLSYLLLLVAAAALAQRFWRASIPATIATVIATASAPVLILHSGAHKNDLLAVWFSVCALLWGSRWVIQGGRLPMLLMILSLALGFGTKTTTVATGIALLPFVAFRIIREQRRGAITVRHVTMTLVTAGLCFLLGGAVPFLMNLARTPDVSDLARATETATTVTQIAYGDWHNLWQVPYLLLTIPFSRNTQGVWVPWRGESWFWPHYEIYFSHYGRLITLIVLALPLVAFWFGRGPDATTRSERRIVLYASLLAIVIMLPTQFRPIGFFAAMVRYFAFIVPIVAAFVIPPAIEALASRSRRLVVVVVTALAAVFSIEAVTCAISDRFAPLEYALWAADHPGTRFIYFNPRRAASIADRLAGPNDMIAVDGAFDTWVYPAYGVRRTRPVLFLTPEAIPDSIPPEARWVIIDRSWNALWSNPNFQNFGQMWRLIGRGKATEEDLRLYRLLRNDRRFVLVFRDTSLNQAVFRRAAP